MVSFRWGNQNLSLPQSADYIKSEMKDFISDGDRNFVVKIKRAIESTQGSEVNNSELLSELKKIREEVLELPLTPFLEQDADGWKGFAQTKVKGSKESKSNISNINFVKEKTIGDITEGAIVGRLRGMGAVKYMKGDELDLPNFDIDEWLDNKKIKFASIPSIGYDIIIRESEAEGRAGTFNFAHKSSESNLDGHIDAIFPVIDEGDLTNAKSEYIMEKTGQQATFKSKTGTKQEIAQEIIDYSFTIPNEVIEKLNKRGGTSSILEQTLTEDGEFEPVIETGQFSGKRIQLTTDAKEKLNMQALLTAINDLSRTEKMKEENIVQIGNKFYSYQLGNADAATKVRLSYKFMDKGSPFSFIRDNKEIFLTILKPYLANPLYVYTAEIVGNIKTKKRPKPMFGQKATDVQSKYFKGKSQDRYEMVTEWTHKKNQEKISPEEYYKLSDEEKENYKPKIQPLTPADIKELTDKAFVNKETGVIITENQYNVLPKEEKEKYKSKIIVTEEGKSGGVGLETFGGTSYDTGSGFQADELKEAFNEAYVDCKIYVKNHGKFNLNPFRQGSPNRSMASHVNKLKKNVRRLRKTLGE